MSVDKSESDPAPTTSPILLREDLRPGQQLSNGSIHFLKRSTTQRAPGDEQQVPAVGNLAESRAHGLADKPSGSYPLHRTTDSSASRDTNTHAAQIVCQSTQYQPTIDPSAPRKAHTLKVPVMPQPVSPRNSHPTFRLSN